MGPQNFFQTLGMAYHSSKADRFFVLLIWTLGALHWDDYKKRNTLCKTPAGRLLFELFGSAVLLAHHQMVPEPREGVWTLRPRGEDNRSHASISRLYDLPIQLHCISCCLWSSSSSSNKPHTCLYHHVDYWVFRRNKASSGFHHYCKASEAN